MDETKCVRTLRSLLFNHSSPEAKLLADNLKTTESLAKKGLFLCLAPDKDSHTGQPHVESVESYINDFLNYQPKLELSYAESYVLLVSVLLHDMGKTKQVAKEKFGNELSKLVNDNNNIKKYKMIETFMRIGNDFSGDPHPIFSAFLLLQDLQKWAIFDEGLADAIARVIVLHDYKIRKYAEEDGWLGDLFLDKYENIRISWLAALLCLADELDESYHRAVNTGKGNNIQSKGKLRNCISGCELDLVGRLLILHPNYNFLKIFREFNSGGGFNENRELINVPFRQVCVGL